MPTLLNQSSGFPNRWPSRVTHREYSGSSVFVQTAPEESNKVLFSALCSTLAKIETSNKRKTNATALADLFQQLVARDPSALLPTIYLLTNQVSDSAYDGKRTNIGERIIISALANMTGTQQDVIVKRLKQTGDIGVTAASLLKDFETASTLSIEQFYQRISTLANITGDTAIARKKVLIQELYLVLGNQQEVKYATRLLTGNLRVGLAESTILKSLAQVFSSDDLTAAKKRGRKPGNALSVDKVFQCLKEHFDHSASWQALITQLLENGAASLLNTSAAIRAGSYFRPMLASASSSVIDTVTKYGSHPFSCEFKYDGERCQVHMYVETVDTNTSSSSSSSEEQRTSTQQSRIQLFSRSGENYTQRYPDIIEALQQSTDSRVWSFVIDCEVVAYNRSNDTIFPFQVLSTRPRKLNTDVATEDMDEPPVSVCLIIFDLLKLNGKSFTDQPLANRRKAMRTAFKPMPGFVMFAEHKDFEAPIPLAETEETSQTDSTQSSPIESQNSERINQFASEVLDYMRTAVGSQCEGLIVKQLDGKYVPGDRSDSWIKLKRDYISSDITSPVEHTDASQQLQLNTADTKTRHQHFSVADSFDLVVIGGYHGKGKRTGVYGAFLLAAYDPAFDRYNIVCKMGASVKVDTLRDLTATLNSVRLETTSIPTQYVVYPRSDDQSEQRAGSAARIHLPDAWFQPSVVLEVKAADILMSVHSRCHPDPTATKGISLRFPRLVRVRHDKRPIDATTTNQMLQLYEQFVQQSMQNKQTSLPPTEES